MRGPLLGVPIIRIIVFGDLYRCSLFCETTTSWNTDIVNRAYVGSVTGPFFCRRRVVWSV